MKITKLSNFIKNHKKPVFISTGVVLSAVIMASVIPFTVAYFTDKATAVNSFHMGSVNIGVAEKSAESGDYMILEDTTDKDKITFNDISTESFTPKYVAVKNINTEALPTVPTYVRVRLIPSVRDAAGALLPIDMKGSVAYDYAPDNTAINGKWVYKDEDVNDITERYYYFDTAVDPTEQGAITDNLINGVKYTGIGKNAIPEGAHFELQVLAEGVAAEQKNNDDESILNSWLGKSTFEDCKTLK